MGCCGHDFGSKEKIAQAIKSNTHEFKQANPQTEKDFTKFRDRRHSSDLRNGVCRNLVETTCVHCPLHPAIHTKDLRIGHCNTNYLCLTARKFETWDKERQNGFIKFIESKKLDNITYSIEMDNGKLMKKFLE
jgi:hypothetical protein